MVPETIAELLERTLEVIRSPERHCIGSGAVDSINAQIGVLHPEADRWSIDGAMALVCEHGNHTDLYGGPKILRRAHRWLGQQRLPFGSRGITGFNDRFSHAEIVEELASWAREARTLGV